MKSSIRPIFIMKALPILLLLAISQSVFADMIVVGRDTPAKNKQPATMTPAGNKLQRIEDQPAHKGNTIQLRQGNLIMVNYDKFPRLPASGSGKKVKTCQAVKMITPAGFAIDCDRNRFNKLATWKSTNGTWLDNLNLVAMQTNVDISIDFKKNSIAVTEHKPVIAN